MLQRGVGSARHRQRRLHPHHRAAPLRGRAGSSSSAIYDTGYIYKGTYYQGLYCVGCEDYYTPKPSSSTGKLPDPRTRARRDVTEKNYFFQLSRFERPPARALRRAPRRRQPESSATRRSASSRRPAGHLDHAHVDHWGIPVPWDERHVVYVWFDALINYAHRDRLRRRDDDEVRQVLAGGRPPDRQGHPPVPLRLLAGDVHGGGHRPAAQVFAHGWLLVGGEKMSKSKAPTRSPRHRPRATDVRRRRLPLPLPARACVRPRRRLLLRGHDARYNADLANNLGNLARARDGGRAVEVRRHRTPRRGGCREPTRRLAAETVDAVREAWVRANPHEALEVTWRLIHEANVELESREPWKLPPGDEVDGILGDALEVLRIVAILASPAIPQARKRSGGGSASRARSPRRGRPRPATARWVGAAIPADDPSRGRRRCSRAASRPTRPGPAAADER